MNILVTGANGFIGKAFVGNLQKDGHIVQGIYSSSLPEGKAGHLCDLTSRDAVHSILPELAKTKWDAVIHLASLLCNDETDGRKVFESNLKMCWNVIDLVRALSPTRVIHASSIAVYPNISECFSESSLTRPSDNAEGLYGLSKLCAENLLDHQLKNEVDCLVHLRLAQVWGEGMRSDRIISMMKDELAKSGKIRVFGNGERTSNFIHVDRLVEYLTGVANVGIQSGVYNVGDESLTYLELAERVAGWRGLDSSVIELCDFGSRARFEIDLSKFQSTWSQISEY